MIFDVETTGLLPKRESNCVSSINIEYSPHILQLSFIVFNTKKNEMVVQYNSYVKVDDLVEISPKITSITGITRKTCQMYGNPIEELLMEFYQWYIKCNRIVAHNLNFDKEMIIIETIRNYAKLLQNGYVPEILFSETYNTRTNKSLFCTMLSGKHVCNLLRVSTFNKNQKYQKYPTLAELCIKLLGQVPIGLHDASVDTRACLDCYLALMKYL